MLQNGTLLRKQERFLQALLLGKSITDAAKVADISRTQAYRWLDDPLIQSEKTRREADLRKAEDLEIQRIMTTGYAAIHERVKSLDFVAQEMVKPYENEKTGKIYQLWNSPDHLREWRGLLDDIASETGGRVKQTKLSGSVDTTAGAMDSLFQKLAAFRQKHDTES